MVQIIDPAGLDFRKMANLANSAKSQLRLRLLDQSKDFYKHQYVPLFPLYATMSCRGVKPLYTHYRFLASWNLSHQSQEA